MLPEVRWRKRLPDAVIRTISGGRVSIAEVKQRHNMVILILGHPPEGDCAAALEGLGWGISERDAVLIVGHDESGALGRAGCGPVVLIADRFGIVFAEIEGRDAILASAQDGTILSWLDFIELQCGECGNPEW